MGATLLPLVIAGHLIGDFIFQTDAHAAGKMKKGWDGWRHDLMHVYTYTLAMATCTVWAFSSGPRFGIFLVVSAVTHAIIDRRWPVRLLMQLTGSPEFSKTAWGVMVTDQALHLSILCILVAALR